MAHSAENNLTDMHVTDLCAVLPGKQVRVVQVDAGRGMQGRLLAMGLIRGAVIRVIMNRGQGPLLIAVGGSRITIGRGMAKKILVQ